MKTIGFIGLGLIGGSIAKQSANFIRITISWHTPDIKETLAAALNSGVIDGVLEKEDERYKSATMFFCAPLLNIT
mgnify:CR=1 FL=1